MASHTEVAAGGLQPGERLNGIRGARGDAETRMHSGGGGGGGATATAAATATGAAAMAAGGGSGNCSGVRVPGGRALFAVATTSAGPAAASAAPSAASAARAAGEAPAEAVKRAYARGKR